MCQLYILLYFIYIYYIYKLSKKNVQLYKSFFDLGLVFFVIIFLLLA